MKLSLDIKTTLTQTLTPQQIQYLKMLQLPVVQFEQYLQQELEQNPMLEDANSPELDDFDYEDDIPIDTPNNEDTFSDYDDDYSERNESSQNDEGSNDYDDTKSYYDDEPHTVRTDFNDNPDPFELYSLVWQDSDPHNNEGFDNYYNDDDEPQFQIKSHTSLEEDLLEQLNHLHLSTEENLLGKYIIGNIEDDGYLRRALNEIVDDTNSFIAESNFEIQRNEYLKSTQGNSDKSQNPAAQFTLSSESVSLLENAKSLHSNGSTNGKSDTNHTPLSISNNSTNLNILNHVNLEQAEKVLAIIQTLDPPGIASRDMQECLISQCKTFLNPNPYQILARRILEEAYEPFIKKHYPVLMKQFDIDEDELKEAIDVIRRLNPKPGGGDSYTELNTVIPDFLVERDEDTNELIISLNDLRLPQLKLSKAYESLRKDAKERKYNKETKNWIRGKREDAKFIIQAIKQRKSTMLKVMTAIATRQKDFFYEGKSGLKPLIYKDIAEETAFDISTVCRIVNNKYVQTEFGTYELKFFFSEALITDEGEDVSTTIIKERIKELLEKEPKKKPYSDELISKLLKEDGFIIARRTVAKYREQMRIPVARLRVEI